MIMVSTNKVMWRLTVCVHEMVCRLSYYDDGIVCVHDVKKYAGMMMI